LGLCCHAEFIQHGAEVLSLGDAPRRDSNATTRFEDTPEVLQRVDLSREEHDAEAA
jgi:hypothetical protein